MRRIVFPLVALGLAVVACGPAPHRQAKRPAVHEDPAPPPQACIVDPVAETVARAQAEGEVLNGDRTIQEEPLPDVDGDGVPERMLAVPSLCGATGNCEYVLFLSNGGCTRSAGPLPGVVFTVQATRHHGLLDVSGWWKGGCVGMEGSSTYYQFDGRSYVATSSLHCDCPADEPASRCARRPAGCPCLE